MVGKRRYVVVVVMHTAVIDHQQRLSSISFCAEGIKAMKPMEKQYIGHLCHLVTMIVKVKFSLDFFSKRLWFV